MHVSVLTKELTAGAPQRQLGSPLHAVKRVVVSVRFAAHWICRLLEYHSYLRGGQGMMEGRGGRDVRQWPPDSQGY